MKETDQSTGSTKYFTQANRYLSFSKGESGQIMVSMIVSYGTQINTSAELKTKMDEFRQNVERPS